MVIADESELFYLRKKKSLLSRFLASFFYVLVVPLLFTLIFSLVLKYGSLVLRLIDDDLLSLVALVPFGICISIFTVISVFIPLFCRHADGVGKAACFLTFLFISLYTLLSNASALGLAPFRGIYIAVNVGVWTGVAFGFFLCYFYSRSAKRLHGRIQVVGTPQGYKKEIVIALFAISLVNGLAVVSYLAWNPAALVLSPEETEKTYPMTAEAGARAAHADLARGVRRVPAFGLITNFEPIDRVFSPLGVTVFGGGCLVGGEEYRFWTSYRQVVYADIRARHPESDFQEMFLL